MNETDLRCQGCGYRTTAAECLGEPEAVLSKGDLSMCLNCGMLYEFLDPGWHRLSRKERRALDKGIRAQIELMELGRRKVITRDLAFEQGI
jgi:hypothetical protein